MSSAMILAFVDKPYVFAYTVRREVNMKQIQKAQHRAFVISMILTVAIIAGIPAIIFGAINKWWILMAVGIACSVSGFYGCPIAWTNYGGIRSLARLVFAVEEEHIYTVHDLAVQLSVSEKEVRKRLNTCFQKHYLTGYRKEEDRITLNESVALEKKQYLAECPNCGAKFTYTREHPRCPYCNSPVKQDTP